MPCAVVFGACAGVLQVLPDAFRDGGEFFRRELQLGVAEQAVFLAVDRQQVDVCVRHFHAQHHHGDTLAGHGLADGSGHFLGKDENATDGLVVVVEEVVFFFLGYDQCVAAFHRTDVQKSKEAVVFGDLVAGDFTRDDS